MNWLLYYSNICLFSEISKTGSDLPIWTNDAELYDYIWRSLHISIDAVRAISILLLEKIFSIDLCTFINTL